MLEQVQSLDLLYEKETTTKLLEFKIRYLVSYATLMRNYFQHMNFEEIVQDLFAREDQKGKQILLIACMIVAPHAMVRILVIYVHDRPTLPLPTASPMRT